MLQGDVKLLTINNLVKKSGYSVGNIYYHYKNIQNFYATIFLRKRLGVYIELINEINNFSSTKTCPDLWKFILEFIFDKITGKFKISIISYLFLQAYKSKEKSYELEQIIDCLIEPLMHCQKRNKTNTFLLIGKEELKLKLRSLRVFIETPFLEGNSIAGKALHFELTLKYCLANFCKT